MSDIRDMIDNGREVSTVGRCPSELAGPTIPLTTNSSSGSVVSLEDVTVKLDSHTIFSGATLSIAPGEFIAVLGPNAAGKSTLLRVLLGLLLPRAGQVEVLGSTPRRGNPAIGYVPQRRALDQDLSVRGRDLVMLGLEGTRWGFPLPGAKRQRYRAQVDEALALAEATALADRPLGQLSGGEQQRLLLAQAIVGQPRLLLLDEPFASMDLRAQAAMAHLVASLARARGLTVLLVTHDINPLQPVVDRVIYIARGKVLIGGPEEIITTECLTRLYGAPIEVLHDSRGRLVVVGQ